MVDDHHGTASMTVDATTQAVTHRYTKPFGETRGATPSAWPDDKGFLGKPADADTGLTHIGAREYDPVTGRFLSVDPVLAPEDHESLNGYAYANNTPVTKSDPTGLRPITACEYGCKNDKGGTDCDTLKADGKGGWKFVSTAVYTSTYQYKKAGGGTGTGVMTVTVRTVEGHESTKVMFRKGPDPAPVKNTGNDDSKTLLDKALEFNHDHRDEIQLIGDVGSGVNYSATGLAGVCMLVTMGACAAGPAEVLATMGKVGAMVGAVASVSQAVDSCTFDNGANCAHDVFGAAVSTIEIALPYIPSASARFVENAQEAYTAGDTSSIIHRLTKWMF
ncbi:RHS repeat domain-containing protein [Streptomyces cacaoi]|uniref:RHS repeat domain-containing protein n=1 Tax=Streptomyces cacaoi TaxID=1898 RepID=UPI003749043B